MYSFKLGDLVASEINGLRLKTGVVVDTNSTSVIIKWTSYNKDYFLEKEDDIFIELNNLYLLSLQSIDRNNAEASLRLLNAS